MLARLGIVRMAWARFAAAPSIRGLFDAVATSVVGLVGGYASLDPRRKIIPRQLALMRSLSANELSSLTLPQLRTLCRRLERDNPTARATVEGLVAQVVGTGIALEPDLGNEADTARVRIVWNDYIRSCDISGRRTVYDIQAQSFREVVCAGEFIWRLPVLPERAAAGLVPLVVLPLECEWIANEPPAPLPEGITAVMGIELDKWGRPVAYHLKNPEFGLPGATERVAAAEIIHEFERRRSLQARGEPWLAPVIERIWQEGDLVDAELKSAITCAAMAIVITSDTHDPVDTTTYGTTADPAQRVGVGAVARLYPGEDIKAFSHSRPAQQIAAFRQTLRGDIAAACRVDQRWLDRDYSRANYSSMRAAMLDTERLLTPVREWFGRATIGALYEKVLPYLCVIAGVKMPKRISYRLLPDAQPYVDPLKDAQAAALAKAFGLTTAEAEVGKRGGDYRQVWEQLAREQQQAAALGLQFAVPNTVVQPGADDPATDPTDPQDAQPIEPPAKKGQSDA